MDLQIITNIILCIFELLQLIGLITVIIILITNKTSKHAEPTQTPITSKAPPLSSLEEEKLRAQRKRFDEELEAFQQILNYNADVAYGINQGETK